MGGVMTRAEKSTGVMLPAKMQTVSPRHQSSYLAPLLPCTRHPSLDIVPLLDSVAAAGVGVAAAEAVDAERCLQFGGSIREDRI